MTGGSVIGPLGTDRFFPSFVANDCMAPAYPPQNNLTFEIAVKGLWLFFKHPPIKSPLQSFARHSCFVEAHCFA